MDLKRIFRQRVQKIEMLNDFIALYCDKSESLEDLRHFESNAHAIRNMLHDVTRLLNEFEVTNRKVHAELMEQMAAQQLTLLELLDKQLDIELAPSPCSADDSTKPVTTATMPTNATSSGCESVLKEISNTVPMTPNRFKFNEPAHMSLADYVKSPFMIKRIKPVALHFFDFERPISADEFAAVPSYMKGRESLEDMQQFLDTVIIQSFTAKYALLPKRREAVPQADLHFWTLYKSQEEYFRGCKFITQGDICQMTNKQIDKKTANRITVLRHLKIIREERKNAAICYIWNKESGAQRR